MPTLTKRILHYAVYALAAVVIAVSGVALYLRVVIMPNADRYKSDIETLAAGVVGRPLRIGHIESDWWGLNPRFSLRDVQLVSATGAQAPLRLARVDATLSWLSLFDWDLRLVSLALYDARVDIRRDPDGIIYVADIPVNAPGPSSPFPDWLLRQRHIIASDAMLTWRDALTGAPPLALQRVNLILRNRGTRHQLGLTARPPADAMQALDVRADLRGARVGDPAGWQGTLYARADAVSAEALQRWAPWAQEQVRQGHGDLRLWLDLRQGQVAGLTSDVRLRDVALSFASDHPDMRFRELSGRLGWSRNRDLHTVLAQGLAFTTENGERIAPTSVSSQVRISPEGALTLTAARAEHLHVEALVALSAAIPMPRPLHDWLAVHRPRGYIENAELQWQRADAYRLTARFRDAGMQADGKMPGFAGLAGHIVATGSGGEAHFDSAGFDLQLDQVFRQPLHLDRLVTDLAWERPAQGGLSLRIGDTVLGNADLDATAQGTLVLRPGQAPLADIQAHLTRGNGNAVWRYLPRQVSDHAHAWLRRSLVAGTSPDTRLVLKGPLDRFPFDQGGGDFSVTIQAKDARLHYADGWPEIQDIQGSVVFRGKGMHIDVSHARALGVDIGPVTAVIPDLHSDEHEVLRIDGQAAGATPGFMEFIRQSPVHEHTGRFTERLRSQGRGELTLHLNLPLRHIEDATVRGDYRILDNQIEPGEDLPALTQVNGVLSFTEDLVRGDNIATRVFGQPAQLKVASDTGGRLRVLLNGRMAVSGLKPWLPAGAERYLSGSASYEAEVGLKAQQTTVRIKSDLAGIESRLPAPLDKAAPAVVPLSLSLGGGKDDARVVNLQYGQLVTGRLLGKPGEPASALLYLGGGAPGAPPREPGLVVMGSLRQLDLDAWRAVELPADAGTGTGTLPLRQINIALNQLHVMQRDFHDTRVKVIPMHKGWRIEIQGREVAGDVVYGEAGGLPGKRFSGHFQRLVIPEATPGAVPAEPGDAAELPRIVEINAQNLVLGKRELGQLNTLLEAERTGLRTRNLVLSNPDGRLQGSGWVSASHRQETEFDVHVESGNFGALLARLGVTEGIKSAPAVIDGQVRWQGRPEDFEIANLGGQLKLSLKAGRFTQLDPGAGRLLGILSLQALPRRIVLDFRDVFSEGFAFDSIEGDVHIERGIAYLPDLVIRGPSAIVRMKGQIDLRKESQDLRVTIQPRLDDSLAVAGAILGGPVVGVGTLVATKLLQNPVGKAATFEYLIKGSWNDPQVTKLARPKAASGESPLTP